MPPTLTIAVPGATGRLGSHIVELVKEAGHDVVPISRSLGVDVVTGEGLDEALKGVDVIIDAATGPSPDEEESKAFFGASARNLQEAGARAGVGRLVVVSIIGVDKFGSGYNAGKVVQEREALAGTLPVSIVRAAQFHEFVEQLVDWGTQGDVGYVPRMRTQLVSARSVAQVLVVAATLGDVLPMVEVAGPREDTLFDAAKLLVAKRGTPERVELGSGALDEMEEHLAGGSLLPNPGALLVGPTYADWLATESFAEPAVQSAAG
jgi:uncharacterized protein YbjT (DUF2867 family)